MKHHNYLSKFIIAGIILLVPSVLYSQTANSSYFLDGSFTRYQLNPALTPERGYLALPILNNFQIDAYSSVGLSNFLYESKSYPDKLTTFMSSEVNKEDFLNALPSVSKIKFGMDMDILAFGFYGFKGMNTFNVKLKNSNNINLPKELFSFMKAGLSDGDYLIEDININSYCYIEAAIGHSHKIKDNLTIGARMKFLLGGYYLDANVDQISAKISDNGWRVNTNATLKASAPGLKSIYKTGTENEIKDFDFDFDGFKSYGFAVDLGASYDMSELVDGLQFSASITDLGLISWNMMTAVTDNKEDVVFEGFSNYDVTGDGDDETMDKLEDDFKNMVKIYDEGTKKENVKLDATFRFGTEYAMPFAHWISVGELLTVRTGINKYSEARTSLILAPSKWFDMTGNIGFSSYGTVYGFMINLHPAGFNLFLASDGVRAKLNPQNIPIEDFYANFVFGINMPIGKRR
jgi:hypothetical protein